MPSFISYGGINEVSGSKHIYKSNKGVKLLIDCGSICENGLNVAQANTGINKQHMPDYCLITHAHLDHIGDLPLLVKEGFTGKIYGTQDTIELIPIALQDNYALLKKKFGINEKKVTELRKELNHQLEFILDFEQSIMSNGFNFDDLDEKRITQLCKKKSLNVSVDYALEFSEPQIILQKYKNNLKNHKIKTHNDIQEIDGSDILPWGKKELKQLKQHYQIIPYGKEFTVSEGLTATFYNAGHILGSTQVKITEQGYGSTVFGGDSGRIDDPGYLETPHLFSVKDSIKNMIIEATYGGRQHRVREDEDKEIVELIQKVSGSILYASFALQRLPDEAQRLLYLKEKNADIPQIILDGVSAKKFMGNFCKYDSYQKLNNELELNKNITWAPKNPTDKLGLVRNKKVIVVSPNGMMNGGPINDYIHSILSDSKSLLIIPGYQAPGTIGHMILTRKVYPFNGSYDHVKAKIYHCQSKSSHASAKDLHTILSSAMPQHTLIVHGATDQKELLQRWIIENKISDQVTIPTQMGKEYIL